MARPTLLILSVIEELGCGIEEGACPEVAVVSARSVRSEEAMRARLDARGTARGQREAPG